MQNSELYRRGFVVPLNREAEQAVTNNNVDEQTSVEFYGLTSEEVFYDLWEMGLFDLINDRLGTMLDDYEEDKIEASQVNLFKGVIRDFEHSNKIADTLRKQVLLELDTLCDIAKEKSRPLFIIL